MSLYVCEGSDQCPISSFRHSLEMFILVLISAIGYALLKRLFHKYKSEFMRAGFSGVDLNKEGRPVLPEAQGVLSGAVYLCIMFVFIPVPFWKFLFSGNHFSPFGDSSASVETTEERSLLFKSQFINYLAGLLSICCMIFLGFADDALNLPWKHKLLMPFVASLPLLMVYLANEGTTFIVIPIFFRNILGGSVDIGVLYYVYMGLLAVFCTNSINIYAGINGLEVGQALIIGSSVILFNLIELQGYLWRVHLFSLYFLIPFMAVCMALYQLNRFPAKLFVGDTFCYFAGMTFAVVGILNHFSKTLLLFFMPQIMNFVYSIPQLFALIPCPRHRLPHFEPSDGLLYPSRVRFHPKSLSRVGQFCLNFLTRVCLVDCRICTSYESIDSTLSPTDLHRSNTDEHDKVEVKHRADTTFSATSLPISTKEPSEEVVEVTNLTLINLVLRVIGPMTELQTTRTLLLLQVLCSCVAFFIRYPLAWFFYGLPPK